MKALSDAEQERAVSLILNHKCDEGSSGFDQLSRTDQQLVRRMNRYWAKQDKREASEGKQLFEGA
jgi:hypothetical protein